MTFYDVWLTTPEPEQQGKKHIFLPEGRAAFFVLVDQIRAGMVRGDQVDPLKWSAQMNREELTRFLDGIFGPEGEYERKHDAGLRHLADRMRKLRAFVAAQPPDAKITVMADEF